MENPAIERTDSPEAKAPTATGRASILVVDDVPANLLAMTALTDALGAEVICADSGLEALRLILEREFAVVLLDVAMPSMDGFETARLIRQRPRSRHLPIIFITAHSDDVETVRAAYRLGAVDFLSKPVVPEMLRAKLAVFIELYERSQSLARHERLLREHHEREHKRLLEQQRQRWETESLRRNNEDLVTLHRRKDEFLAVLSHELRTPLASMVAGLDLLRMKLGGVADASVHRARDIVDRQARQLARLVDDLLDVSRIEAGKIELRLDDVAVETMVEQAVAAVRPTLDEKRHALHLDLPTEALFVLADPARVTQVLSNVLANAARYTDPGGTIRVACAAVQAFVELRVQDNGRGISADILPRVFEPFVQERSAAEGGMGLGLNVVKRLVEMHGGTVAAHSEGPGRGAEVVIRLPRAYPKPRAAEHAEPPPVARPHALSVVLVEDDADVREMTSELLKALGHRVSAAPDAESGVDAICSLAPDLALVDIGLPGVSGYGVPQKVRERLGAHRVRIVALTGYGDEAARQRASESGFAAYLVKPVDLSALEGVLGETSTG